MSSESIPYDSRPPNSANQRNGYTAGKRAASAEGRLHSSRTANPASPMTVRVILDQGTQGNISTPFRNAPKADAKSEHRHVAECHLRIHALQQKRRLAPFARSRS